MELNLNDFNIRDFYDALVYVNGAKKEFNLTPNQNKRDRMSTTLKTKVHKAMTVYANSKNMKMTDLLDKILIDHFKDMIKDKGVIK